MGAGIPRILPSHKFECIFSRAHIKKHIKILIKLVKYSVIFLFFHNGY